MNDLALQDAVLAELEWGPRVDASEVEVTAKRGAVTLEGDVTSYPQKTGDGYVTVRGGVDWAHQREEALRAVRHRYGNAHRIDCMTKIWAAGVSAAPLGARLARAAGAETDSTGRIKVEPECTVAGHPEISWSVTSWRSTGCPAWRKSQSKVDSTQPGRSCAGFTATLLVSPSSIGTAGTWRSSLAFAP